MVPLRLSSLSRTFLFLFLFLLKALVLTSCVALCLGQSDNDVTHTASHWCPNVFYNFGDSLSDTGNIIRAIPTWAIAVDLPYGESFFGKPTGRHSNGRLVIDFIRTIQNYFAYSSELASQILLAAFV
jgi:hypothetical protein